MTRPALLRYKQYSRGHDRGLEAVQRLHRALSMSRMIESTLINISSVKFSIIFQENFLENRGIRWKISQWRNDPRGLEFLPSPTTKARVLIGTCTPTHVETFVARLYGTCFDFINIASKYQTYFVSDLPHHHHVLYVCTNSSAQDRVEASA